MNTSFKQNGYKVKLAKGALSLAVITAIGLFSVGTEAQAQAVTIVKSVPLTVTCTTRAGGIAGAAKSMAMGGVSCASEDTLMTIAKSLQAGNTEAAKSVEGQTQNVLNADLGNRAATVDKATRDAIAPYAAPMTAEACREATAKGAGVAGGASGSGAGGVTGNSAAREGSANNKQEERLLSSKTIDATLAEIVGPRSKHFCTAADVTNKVPNCTTRGPLPGANMRFSSLLSAANAVPGKANRSIPDNEDHVSMIAARHYINLMSPRNAPDIPASSKDKPSAKKFLAVQKIYNASALSITNFMDHSLAWTTAIPSNHPFAQVWNSNPDLNEEYRATYPGRDKPQAPSQREFVYFQVEKQNTLVQESKDQAGRNDPAYLAFRNLELQKLNAILLLRINEQLEYNGAVQAALLKAQIDPVSYRDLAGMLSSVN